jgi:hypothetical protein
MSDTRLPGKLSRGRAMNSSRRGIAGWLTIEIFNNLFIDPLSTILASPNLAPNELSRNRATWDDHAPQVPGVMPSGIWCVRFGDHLNNRMIEAAGRNTIDRRLRHGGPGREAMSDGKTLSSQRDLATKLAD